MFEQLLLLFVCLFVCLSLRVWGGGGGGGEGRVRTL